MHRTKDETKTLMMYTVACQIRSGAKRSKPHGLGGIGRALAIFKLQYGLILDLKSIFYLQVPRIMSRRGTCIGVHTNLRDKSSMDRSLLATLGSMP